MKPLRTILEETRAVRSHLEDEDILCEGIKSVSRMADMPMVLVFRRRSYRPMGAGQTVALYYCSTDKYLSIPFGPGGALGDNLNLSEETDNLNEAPDFVAEFPKHGHTEKRKSNHDYTHAWATKTPWGSVSTGFATSKEAAHKAGEGFIGLGAKDKAKAAIGKAKPLTNSNRKSGKKQ